MPRADWIGRAPATTPLLSLRQSGGEPEDMGSSQEGADDSSGSGEDTHASEPVEVQKPEAVETAPG